MSSRDDRRVSDRKDHHSPPRRSSSPNVRGNKRCRDCDFIGSSMGSLKAHFRRTSHKPLDDLRDPRTRTERSRRSGSRERRRRSGSRERCRRSCSRERCRRSGSRERCRRSGSRERRRRSGSRERRRRSGSIDAAKAKKPDSASQNVPEKKPDPVPESESEKKPDPTPTGVPGMVPDHIRKSLSVLQDYVSRTEREPIIGLQYILEYKVQVRYDKIDIKYFCEMCEMDSTVIPMVDHVCGFKHRKLYVAKEYPYVLPALFKTKEDKAMFMRRIAVEIEEEEGTRMYKTDPLVRMVPMMNLKAIEAKQSKRRTRWDPEGDRQKKMEQALDFLDFYEIDTEDDVATVTDLLDKLSTDLKSHTDKLREEALFPAKVAKAKGVAVTITRNAVIAWMYQRHVARTNRLRKKHSLARPGAPFLPNNAAFPQWPFNQPHNMPRFAFNNQPGALPFDPEDEDIHFLKNLMELLDVLPDSLTEEDDSLMDAEFLMLLKSALLDKTENADDVPVDQLMQIASLAQDLADMDDAPPNRIAPKNPAAMADVNSNVLMQMASTVNVVANSQAGPNLLRPMATANIAAHVANSQECPILPRQMDRVNIGAPVANLQAGPTLPRQMGRANIGAPLINAQAGPNPLRQMATTNIAAPVINSQAGPSPLRQTAMSNIGIPLINAQAGPNPLRQLTTSNIAAPVANAQIGPNPLRQMGTANIPGPFANAQAGPNLPRQMTKANIGMNASAAPNLLRQLGTANIPGPFPNAQAGPNPPRQMTKANIGINASAGLNPLRQLGTANIPGPFPNAQAGPNLPRQMTEVNIGMNASAGPNPLRQLGTANIPGPFANAQAGPNPLRPPQNHQLSVNSLLPENRNVLKRDLLTGSGMPPYTERQPGHSGTPQIDDFGFAGRMPETFPKKRRSRFDDPAEPMGYASSEQPRDRISSVHSREWDEPPYRNIPPAGVNREYFDKEAAYSRVSEQERFLDDRFIRDIRAQEVRPDFGERPLTSFDDPAWIERDLRYAKRSRMDSDVGDWGRRYPDESDSPGPPKLSANLLKMIRGKDLFTASAILSEVAQGHSST